jgi:hypothetical protein
MSAVALRAPDSFMNLPIQSREDKMSETHLHQTIYAVISELRLLAAAGLKFATTHHEIEI